MALTLWIALGGAIGSVARFWLSVWAAPFSRDLPWGTIGINVAGSFLTWQSASSFGQRRFINSTLIFALGMAALVAWLVSHGWPRWTVVTMAALFIAWNAGLLMQYALWCSPQRQGLDWSVVLKGQIEMPGRALGLISVKLTSLRSKADAPCELSPDSLWAGSGRASERCFSFG